jgi:hypothetical protein
LGEGVAVLFEPAALDGVVPQDRASDAAVLVLSARAVCAAAFSGGELAAFEVAEEFVPFGVGRGAVFLAGAQVWRRAKKAR